MDEKAKEKCKKYALQQFGQAYHQWKTDLNASFVKTGRSPLTEFGRITPAQWDKFVRQRTTPKAITKSKANSDLTKRNVHTHRLGPGGYLAKKDKWATERQEAIAKGLPNPYEGLDERSFNWIKAHEVKVDGGSIDFAKPETREVASRIMTIAEKQKVGEFVPNRKIDALTVGLGNPEHGGCVRAVSSKLNWKEGFV
ncbi:hypothetical protein BS78_04G018000 [Paspalum vaginatum]|nr:hypothetical protein BS78_04G018000 [Paspalum vaginatum]